MSQVQQVVELLKPSQSLYERRQIVSKALHELDQLSPAPEPRPSDPV